MVPDFLFFYEPQIILDSQGAPDKKINISRHASFSNEVKSFQSVTLVRRTSTIDDFFTIDLQQIFIVVFLDTL